MFDFLPSSNPSKFFVVENGHVLGTIFLHNTGHYTAEPTGALCVKNENGGYRMFSNRQTAARACRIGRIV